MFRTFICILAFIWYAGNTKQNQIMRPTAAYTVATATHRDIFKDVFTYARPQFVPRGKYNGQMTA